MNQNKTKSFRFYTRLHLQELTGFRASNLEQLLEFIKSVPGSVIYHHTHRFLQQHLYLLPEPPNDFAYWVSEYLGEDVLGEKLASIDTIQFGTIRSLREKIVNTIEKYMEENPLSRLKFASETDVFHFVKTVSFVMPTPYEATNLKEFADILKKVTVDSIYFHIFESKLRLERKENDFSYWIDTSIGDSVLAKKIAEMDPYTQTMEGLRKTLIRLVESRIK